ncbi:MAG: GNAT family N-acetyltransferase [Candidatus Bathyarchaeia archaeon]
MKVKEVDFQSLKNDWDTLLNRNILGNNVFLTWEWLSTWWKHFGEGRKLLLLIVEDKGEIIAIAPLMLSKYKLPIFGTIKKVEFVGVGQSDYNNFIILKKEAECIKFILDYLVNAVADWDWVELKEIPETSENLNYLGKVFASTQQELKLNKRVCNMCPYIPLPNSFDMLLKKLGRNMRQNLNKYLRKIKSNHRIIEFKKYDETGFSVADAMKLFTKLHEARWTAEGSGGAFKNNPCFRNFHFEVAEIFANKGWLGLYFLLVDHEPVSTQYAFEYEGKIYYYLGGFNPEYSRYSVGNLTIMFLLERGIQKGFKEYDMMRGNEPYKLFWTRNVRRNFEIRLVKKGITRKVYNWLTWSDVVNSLAAKLKLSLKMDCAQQILRSVSNEPKK